MKVQHALAFFIMALALSHGCALSPQAIALRPAIDAAIPPLGNGRELHLLVVDQRPDPKFGARGGVYDTAYISPRTDVAEAVRQALAERFEAAQFRVVDRAAPLSLRVGIGRIDYTVAEGAVIGSPAVNDVSVSAVFTAEARGPGRTVSGQYQASRAGRFVGYPDAAANEMMLNEVVAQALAQLLQDSEIVKVLVGQP